MAKRVPKQRLHQSAVPGAFEVIEDIEETAKAQQNAEQDLSEARKAVDDAQGACMAAMRKHSKTFYRTSFGYTATLRPGKDKVIVKKAGDGDRKPRSRRK